MVVRNGRTVCSLRVHCYPYRPHRPRIHPIRLDFVACVRCVRNEQIDTYFIRWAGFIYKL